MNLKILSKLVVLLTALTATVVAMMWLNQGHMVDFWASLGVDRSGQRLNWCTERVQSLYFYDSKSKLLEEEGKWLWSQGDVSKVVDYLRVEKWFAKHCMIQIDEASAEPSTRPLPLFEAQFINGDHLTIYQFSAGVFKIQGKRLKSDSLQEGIKELLAFDNQLE